MRCAIIILLLVVLHNHSHSQDRAIIDSLKNVIATADHDLPTQADTTKIKILNKLSWDYLYTHPDTSYYYANEALKLSQALDNKKKAGQSYINIANSYYVKSAYPQAIENYKNARKIYWELNDQQGIANSSLGIGIIYYNQSDYPMALQYYFESLKIQEKLGNEQGMARTYNNIGVIYKNQSDYSQALDYYFKTLEIEEELGNKQGMASSYNNIGNIYDNQSEYPQALDYYFKALKIDEEMGNKRGMATSYTNIGSSYTSIYEQAVVLSNDGGDSLAFGGVSGPVVSVRPEHPALNESKGGRRGVEGWASRNPAKLLDTAMYYQRKALAIDKENSDEYGMTFKLSGIADIYFKKGAAAYAAGNTTASAAAYGHALTYYQEAVMLADSIGAVQQASYLHRGLSETYEKLGQFSKSLTLPAEAYYTKALDHYKQYATLKDSTFNEEKSKDLGKLEAKHEFEMAEQERIRREEDLAAREEEQKSRRDNLQYSAILIFIVLLFASVFFIGRFSIPIRLAEGMIFFAFLLFFEFTLVLLDPYIEQYSSGAPAIKLAFNAILAALIFPLHSFFENTIKKRIVTK
ncbi:tetratricopeptide repeat protein [Flavobacteriales bacterium AH-315-E23]|nr:tetratricopeptide repeat protein [Flavobacteriales bacterium AH-315-E23]